MKYYFFILLYFLFSCCKNESLKTVKLTDKEIAVLIAEQKFLSIYGKSVNKQKPFAAEKKNDSIWIVHGTLPKPTIGGVAYAEVNVRTKKVIRYTHGE